MSRLLTIGSTGEDVRALQAALNKHGAHLAVDGQFGPLTRAAVIQFQAAHDCTVDGVAGPQTNRALLGFKPVPPPHVSSHKLGERAFQIATTLLAVREVGGENIGPMVDRIIRENGGARGESWCGDFVAYCYRHAGSKAVERAWASVPMLGHLGGLVRVQNPERGDLCRFDWNRDGVGDHVELFDHWVSRKGGLFATIGGNTGPGLGGVFREERRLFQTLSFQRVLR